MNHKCKQRFPKIVSDLHTHARTHALIWRTHSFSFRIARTRTHSFFFCIPLPMHNHTVFPLFVAPECFCTLSHTHTHNHQIFVDLISTGFNFVELKISTPKPFRFQTISFQCVFLFVELNSFFSSLICTSESYEFVRWWKLYHSSKLL